MSRFDRAVVLVRRRDRRGCSLGRTVRTRDPHPATSATGNTSAKRAGTVVVGCVALLASLMVFSAGSPAAASPIGTVTRFTNVGVPYGITKGPDGNLWFTNAGGPPDWSGTTVGRITPTGTVTAFTGTGIKNPSAITAGPDGNLWFVNLGTYPTFTDRSIGRVTPTGTVTNFTGTGISFPGAVTAGPDGNVWFTAVNDSIGRITPTGVITNFTGGGISNPQGITGGPDGNLWFTNAGTYPNYTDSSIGRMTPTGAVTNFTGTGISNPQGITGGPDGNLWFTNAGNNSIGRITLAGVVTNFTGIGTAISNPGPITAGPDSNLWFANTGTYPNYTALSIGRITPTGVVTSFSGNGIINPFGITGGPDGGVWFTNSGTYPARAGSSIGRVTAANLPDAPTGVEATAGVAAVSVSWAAPFDGGSPITGYTVTAAPGGATCSWTTGPLSCTVNGLTIGAPYTFTVTATNAVGTGPPSVASAPATAVAAPPATFFHPLNPTRILDSRGPTGGWNTTPLVVGTPRALTVAGPGTGVPSGAAAVVLNVTSTGATADSFLTAYPTGAAVPNVSNLNFAAGQTIPNLVTVKVGAAGQVSFANNAGATDVVADIAGYFDTVPADKYNPVTPQRVLDSRNATGGWNTTPLVAGIPRALTLRGTAGVPASADAVILNVTVTGGTADSYLTAYPAGTTTPKVSNLNFAAGQTIANLVTVKLDAAGVIEFNNNTGTVNVIADIAGYFDTTTGDLFHPLNPTRILDSRGTLGGWNITPLTSSTPRPFTVTGGVPAGATAVIANTTATGATDNSYLTVYPAGTVATVSNLNFAAGQTIPNLTAVKLNNTGTIEFKNNTGTVNVIFDIAGYFAAT